jgi:hypothetical protein
LKLRAYEGGEPPDWTETLSHEIRSYQVESEDRRMLFILYSNTKSS